MFRSISFPSAMHTVQWLYRAQMHLTFIKGLLPPCRSKEKNKSTQPIQLISVFTQLSGVDEQDNHIPFHSPWREV